MIYQEYRPPREVEAVVACFWRFAIDSAQPGPVQHAVPPDGTVTLTLIPTGRAFIVGPRLSALRVEVYPGTEYVGIRLRPGASTALLGLSGARLRGQSLPLAEVLPVRGRQIEEVVACLSTASARLAVLPNVVSEWLHELEPNALCDPVVSTLVERILASDGMTSISASAKGLGLSYRQVLRRFFHAVGLTPKELARLRRVRAACVRSLAADQLSWAALSAETGFADQAHLAREFSTTFQWPPGLVKEYLNRIEHRGLIS